MLSDVEKRVIRVLQDSIPMTAEPYKELAERAGMTQAEFLAVARRLKDEGKLRRVGAMLQHRRAGFMANGLCTWAVSQERLDELGEKLSRENVISHCYCRRPAEGWPYNLYVMIHARTRSECEAIAARLSLENGLGSYHMLYSVREWKKASMKYFVDKQPVCPLCAAQSVAVGQ